MEIAGFLREGTGHTKYRDSGAHGLKLADVLTKPLAKIKFFRFITAILCKNRRDKSFADPSGIFVRINYNTTGMATTAGWLIRT